MHADANTCADAAQVEVCCFDKTGTLTSDNLLFEGITGLTDALDSTALETAAKKLPPTVARVLAGCQSLVRVDGQLVGDPLELAAFNAVGAGRLPICHSHQPPASPTMFAKLKHSTSTAC